MPLVDINVVEGVFSQDAKKALIQKVTDAVVSVEGEKMRGVTWVRILEVKSSQWAIGGQPLTSEAIRAMAAAR